VNNGPTVGRDGVVVPQAVAARKLPPGTSSAGSDVWKGAEGAVERWPTLAHIGRGRPVHSPLALVWSDRQACH
jgi:hypothetical protein